MAFASTRKFTSRSNPETKHTVKIKKQGRGFSITCSCRGFKTHHHCWHHDKVQIEIRRAL